MVSPPGSKQSTEVMLSPISSTVVSPQGSTSSYGEFFEYTSQFTTDEKSVLYNHQKTKRKPGTSCAQCHHEFKGFMSKKSKYCRYCGKLFCSDCCKHKFVVPSKIIRKGDFESHDVCSTCNQYLLSSRHLPLIQFRSLRPEAIRVIGKSKYDTINELQGLLVDYIYSYFLPDCPSRYFLLSLIPTRYHSLLTEQPLVSIVDLCELKSTRYTIWLQNLAQIFDKHVQCCKHCSNKKRDPSKPLLDEIVV